MTSEISEKEEQNHQQEIHQDHQQEILSKEENTQILIKNIPETTTQEILQKLFEKYGVDKVIFGHLHGYSKCDLVTEKNGISYYLTSCDKINNEPVLIYE